MVQNRCLGTPFPTQTLLFLRRYPSPASFGQQSRDILSLSPELRQKATTSKGVFPSLSLTRWSAPDSSSNRTMSRWPQVAAKCNSVWSVSVLGSILTLTSRRNRNVEVTILSGKMEWHKSILCHRLSCCTRLNQQSDDVKVALGSCQMHSFGVAVGSVSAPAQCNGVKPRKSITHGDRAGT